MELEAECTNGRRCWFVAVHDDGTARLYDLASRKELLRIGGDQPVTKAAFVAKAGEGGDTLGIVTLAQAGRLQAWATQPTQQTVPQAVAR